MRFVQIQDNGCWIWQGASSKGYPDFYDSDLKKNVKATRFLYRTLIGPIPDGFCVCHRCDTPMCVSPMHLWAGTMRDNLIDRNQKRRHAHGESHGTARLTEQQVRDIREMHSLGAPGRELARRYGVDKKTITRVVRRINWKHVI